MALIVNPIADLVVRDAETRTINLFNNFDDSRTTGLVARFELYNASLGGGITNLLLFDQAGNGAPLTVQNFRKYVSDGDYVNTIIHRSIPGFVVQGGGFTVNAVNVRTVLTDPPVQNEFSPNRSNLRGTIAMAKLGTDPNSATSQWFFNLANNSANLDTQNGGFTVFGQVLSAADLAPLDAIAALPDINTLGFAPVFSDIPLLVSNPAAPVITSDDNFVRYRNITVSRVSELRFEVVNNSNPDAVTATIVNNQLVLNSRSAQTRTAAITIRATTLLGQSTEDTFLITVEPTPPQTPPATNLPTVGADVLTGTTATDVINGLAGNDRILGLAGNDRLVGGVGKDVLDGGAGSDRLAGGLGKDTITTGSGRDTIVIARQDGLDVVTDFSDRLDKIQLVGGLSFNQLTFVQRGDNLLIRAGRTNLVLLEDVNVNSLNRADFR